MRQRLNTALEITGFSDIGKVRKKNEDSITWNPTLGLAILSDGMGGANAGEVAGSIAAETILKQVMVNIEAMPPGLEIIDQGENHTRASLVLCSALHRANREILHIAQEQPEYRGMGATTIGALFYDNQLSVCHVGDSRLYLMRQGLLQQVTEDHTVIQKIINSGIYTREQTKNINKNIVTRAVGVTANLKIDILEKNTFEDDVYMLCSDGLSDLVSDTEIQQQLNKKNNIKTACRNLIDLANKYGGTDNISVILIRVLKPYPAKSNLRQRLLRWIS